MVEDVNLSTFEVTYLARGEITKTLVRAHNDAPYPGDEYDGHGEHYILWRYMPNNMRVVAFRCRYDQFISTAAIANSPPKAEELQELERLRQEAGDLRERVAMADARVVVAEDRVADAGALGRKLQQDLEAARHENARLKSELVVAQGELVAAPRPSAPPEQDDVPF